MFVDRDAELTQLEQLLQTKEAQLFVLYGRRRVGKTELLRAFCKDKAHLFFIATMSSDSDQLATFSQHIWGFIHSEIPEGFTFPSWEAAFRALVDLPGRPIVVLDEFTYLIGGNKAIPSILQKVWDESLKDTKVFLILCGSYVGMMEAEVLGYQAPLYGRRTGSLFLQALSLPAATAFFPNYTPVQQIEAWSVLGGMPYYLETFDDASSVYKNIRSHVLDTQGRLHNEPRLVLMEELREPRNYFSILRAIAQGRTRLNEIAQGAGVGNASTTARYLDILQRMRLIERKVPATESQPQKSKKGIYKFRDPFLRFWFRYVHPNIGSLELGLANAILAQRVRATFQAYVGQGFGEAARAHTAQLARMGELPFLPERIGGWWDRRAEIDLAAVSDSEGSILLGECKWSSRPLGVNIWRDLEEKSRLVLEGRHYQHVHYVLFSRAGFTPAMRVAAKDESVLLIKPQEMVR
ncbi:MAG: ATP-binding protein [Anaerolineales bacterium]